MSLAFNESSFHIIVEDTHLEHKMFQKKTYT